MGFARVQNAADGANSTSLTITLGATPAAGNLLIAWANSDATVTHSGTGWTAGPSVIDGNGAYTWWKIAGSSEPAAVTFTPSVSDYICAGLLEYSGNTPSPLDAASSSTHSGTATSSTTAVTVTTTEDHDLGIACALLHSSTPNSAVPTAPAWTNGWSNVQAQGAVSPTWACWSYIGDNLDLGTAGAAGTAVSWSTVTWLDAQELLLTFKAAAGGGWTPQIVSPNQGFF